MSYEQDVKIAELLNHIEDLRDTCHFWLKRIDLRRLSLEEHKLFNEAHKLIRKD